MFIEKDLKPKLIGKLGRNIKRVQQHATTNIYNYNESLERIEITGTESSVHSAMEELKGKNKTSIISFR